MTLDKPPLPLKYNQRINGKTTITGNNMSAFIPPSTLSTSPKNTTCILKFVQYITRRVVFERNCFISHARQPTRSDLTEPTQVQLFIHDSSQFKPQISNTGPSRETNGLIRTHMRVKIEARRIDQTNTIVGILSCFPSNPFRNG